MHSSDKLLHVQTSKRAKKVIDENFISEELKTIIGKRVLQCYGKWTLWYKAASKVFESWLSHKHYYCKRNSKRNYSIDIQMLLIRSILVIEDMSKVSAKQLDFFSRKKSSTDVDIPETINKEIMDSFLQEIVLLTEEFEIPDSLIVVLNEILPVSVGNQPITEKGGNDVTLLGYLHQSEAAVQRCS